MKTMYSFIYSLMMVVTESLSQQILEGLNYLDHKPIRLLMKDGKIVSITSIKSLHAGDQDIYISPGLIDNQVNGFAGVSFALGNNDLKTEDVKKATKKIWENGVTTYIPTLTTNSKEVLIRNFKTLATACEDPSLMASVPGFHLEGPFINPEDGYRGAHPKAFVHNPDWNEFMEYYEASGKKIKQITLAPELKGALDFIKACKSLGIQVALGHHNANSVQIKDAVTAGASISTHLGNGCANMIHRHNNPLWPQLANDHLSASIICDGFHLTPDEVNTFYKVKGKDKIIITSDVTSYATLPPGQYQTQTGETIELTPEGKLQYPAQQVMYGSASPIKNGIGNIMKFTGCSLSEAINMATANVARFYGWNDRGALKIGYRADVIRFKMIEGKMDIQETWVGGVKVY